MKKSINNINQVLVFTSIVLMSSMSFALECSKATLTCKLIKTIGANSPTESAPAKTVGFTAVNNDEPSLPPNSCEAYLPLKSSFENVVFTASLVESDVITAYFYIGKNNGALDPQFSTEIKAGQKVSLYYKTQSNPKLGFKSETMECVLN